MTKLATKLLRITALTGLIIIGLSSWIGCSPRTIQYSYPANATAKEQDRAYADALSRPKNAWGNSTENAIAIELRLIRVSLERLVEIEEDK